VVLFVGEEMKITLFSLASLQLFWCSLWDGDHCL